MKKIEEPEFIVSSEELKRNRERAILREEIQREEKKEKIITIIGLIVGIVMIIAFFKLLSVVNTRDYNTCLSNGGSEQICKKAIEF
jgi:hypothetical protein